MPQRLLLLRRRQAWLAALGLCVVLTFGTASRNRVYATEVTFWQDVVAKSPHNPRAWNNLGIAYEQAGNFPEAKKCYDKALVLEPKNNFIRQNFDMFMEIYDRQNRRRNS